MPLPNGVQPHQDWDVDFTLRGAALLDALPDEFSFEDLMEAADNLELPSEEAVEHLRIMMREEMVRLDGDTFFKRVPLLDL